jgi:hypothetical protein
VPNKYVITAVPAEKPATMPLDEPTVAIEEAVPHVPPDVTFESVIAPPAHTVPGPLMAAGTTLIVKLVVI